MCPRPKCLVISWGKKIKKWIYFSFKKINKSQEMNLIFKKPEEIELLPCDNMWFRNKKWCLMVTVRIPVGPAEAAARAQNWAPWPPTLVGRSRLQSCVLPAWSGRTFSPAASNHSQHCPCLSLPFSGVPQPGTLPFLKETRAPGPSTPARCRAPA